MHHRVVIVIIFLVNRNSNNRLLKARSSMIMNFAEPNCRSMRGNLRSSVKKWRQKLINWIHSDARGSRSVIVNNPIRTTSSLLKEKTQVLKRLFIGNLSNPVWSTTKTKFKDCINNSGVFRYNWSHRRKAKFVIKPKSIGSGCSSQITSSKKTNLADSWKSW